VATTWCPAAAQAAPTTAPTRPADTTPIPSRAGLPALIAPHSSFQSRLAGTRRRAQANHRGARRSPPGDGLHRVVSVAPAALSGAIPRAAEAAGRARTGVA